MVGIQNVTSLWKTVMSGKTKIGNIASVLSGLYHREIDITHMKTCTEMFIVDLSVLFWKQN